MALYDSFCSPACAVDTNQTTVTAFTVEETLHLIPDSEMSTVDKKSFPDFAYCPINESKSRPKDAKIQFVALITSKPVVGSDQRIHWTVADKTGTVSLGFLLLFAVIARPRIDSNLFTRPTSTSNTVDHLPNTPGTGS